MRYASQLILLMVNQVMCTDLLSDKFAAHKCVYASRAETDSEYLLSEYPDPNTSQIVTSSNSYFQAQLISKVP